MPENETKTAHQVYEQTIKPLSTREKLTIARLIINEVVPDTAPTLHRVRF